MWMLRLADFLKISPKNGPSPRFCKSVLDFTLFAGRSVKGRTALSAAKKDPWQPKWPFEFRIQAGKAADIPPTATASPRSMRSLVYVAFLGMVDNVTFRSEMGVKTYAKSPSSIVFAKTIRNSPEYVGPPNHTSSLMATRKVWSISSSARQGTLFDTWETYSFTLWLFNIAMGKEKNMFNW